MTSKLTRDIIQSEIADFFAGVVEIHTELGGPNTVEEAQNQLMERVLACVPVVDSEPVAWIHEDELPDGYPYDAMFPFSKVDIVRMFPVFAPQPAQQPVVPDGLVKAVAFYEQVKRENPPVETGAWKDA
ncbi:hypothetical protein ACQ4OG_00535, partial [Escherichia coli]